MKKFLLPEGGQFYKANLHCHTTVSDGDLTPLQVKEAYKARGYSVVAYTDHTILVGHQDLTDDSFLAMNGVEVDVSEARSITDRVRKTCHICMVALNPKEHRQVCFDPEWLRIGNTPKYWDELKLGQEPVYKLSYTPECVSDVMRVARERDFFVTYNHPAWSMETRDQYIHYHNMHALEICNYSSYQSGYEDYTPFVYDEMLREGKRIFCIAADDNHNDQPFDSFKVDSFGAYTMIKAEKLDYPGIADALRKGHFYASTGPQIKELWYEDGEIHITCSEARRVFLNTGWRRAEPFGYNGDKPVTHAHFKVKEKDGYVRLTVQDFEGKRANTNAYFVEDLMK